MDRPKIDTIPDVSVPVSAEASPSSAGQEAAIWIQQLRPWFLQQLRLREKPGYTLQDYLPTEQQEALFGALPPTHPVIILEEREKQWFSELMDDAGLIGFDIDDGNDGSNIAMLGLSIVWRNPTLEQQFGKELTASVAVHELAHSAHAWKDNSLHLRTRAGSTRLSGRTGFSVEGDNGTMNEFFEEGFAEYMRLQYLTRFARHSPLIEAIRRTLNIARTNDVFTTDALIGDPKHPTQVPAALLQPSPGGRIERAGMPAMAVRALLLLRDHDPSLIHALHEARCSPHGLNAFWQVIRRNLGSAACEQLCSVQYTNEDGMRGQEIVCQALAQQRMKLPRAVLASPHAVTYLLTRARIRRRGTLPRLLAWLQDVRHARKSVALSGRDGELALSKYAIKGDEAPARTLCRHRTGLGLAAGHRNDWRHVLENIDLSRQEKEFLFASHQGLHAQSRRYRRGRRRALHHHGPKRVKLTINTYNV